jgi:hypothetical protein
MRGNPDGRRRRGGSGGGDGLFHRFTRFDGCDHLDRPGWWRVAVRRFGRFTVAGLAGCGMFALVWWLAEAVGGLSRPDAIAGWRAGGRVPGGGLAWWASRDEQPSRQGDAAVPLPRRDEAAAVRPGPAAQRSSVHWHELHVGKRDYLAFIDKPFPQGESFRDFARRVREFLDEKSKQHREHTIITIGWRLSPSIFAHICRGVSLERAITDNANISGPFTYR